jgi:hypothetical protein
VKPAGPHRNRRGGGVRCFYGADLSADLGCAHGTAAPASPATRCRLGRRSPPGRPLAGDCSLRDPRGLMREGEQSRGDQGEGDEAQRILAHRRQLLAAVGAEARVTQRIAQLGDQSAAITGVGRRSEEEGERAGGMNPGARHQRIGSDGLAQSQPDLQFREVDATRRGVRRRC